jgi:carbamoyltransferase
MILGITSNNHDASLALIDGDKIVWAAHSERYSRIKNDSVLNQHIINDMQQYGSPTEVVWFEQPLLKNTRQLYARQPITFATHRNELKKFKLNHLPVHFTGHHCSHAAGGYFTSGFRDAAILVVDAIGEWDTVSIWSAKDTVLSKIWTKKYPNSIGLFYSAMTAYLGLKPNEEEYILMGMAAYGQPIYKNEILDTFFQHISAPDFELKFNMHKGCNWWVPSNANFSKYDIAASVQSIVEDYLLHTIKWMKTICNSDNLVLMGGIALNCVANSIIARENIFKNIWIMPNPGDSGSAIGAVAAYTNSYLTWDTPFLGTNIERTLDIDSIVKKLKNGEIVAVANGRAEFGPRAFGNRSLLCDPRGPNAKALMNTVKHREQFRPFAPAILEEYAHSYFDIPVSTSPYMQYVSQCLYPNELPGICHIDNSSRVQTVTSTTNSQFRLLLEAWHNASGCPILMNTSLNVRGEPLVNTWEDAYRFSELTGVSIF